MMEIMCAYTKKLVIKFVIHVVRDKYCKKLLII